MGPVGPISWTISYVQWSKVAILGMVIPPLIGNPYNGYVNPYYWVDDHPPLCGNNGSLDSDPGTYVHRFEDVHHPRQHAASRGKPWK